MKSLVLLLTLFQIHNVSANDLELISFCDKKVEKGHKIASYNTPNTPKTGVNYNNIWSDFQKTIEKNDAYHISRMIKYPLKVYYSGFNEQQNKIIKKAITINNAREFASKYHQIFPEPLKLIIMNHKAEKLKNLGIGVIAEGPSWSIIIQKVCNFQFINADECNLVKIDSISYTDLPTKIEQNLYRYNEEKYLHHKILSNNDII